MPLHDVQQDMFSIERQSSEFPSAVWLLQGTWALSLGGRDVDDKQPGSLSWRRKPTADNQGELKHGGSGRLG